MKNAPLLLALLASSAMARPRDIDTDRAPACNQGAVQSCVQRHSEARALVQSWLNANEAVLSEQAERVASMKKNLIPLEARQSSVSAGIRSLEAEHAHLRQGETEARAKALLGGKVSVEDYFRLHPLHRSWGERYPSERLRKLTEVMEKQREHLSEVKGRIEKVLPNLNAASSQYQSALARKNSWLAELHQHDGMCREGCKNELCPPR